MKAITLYQPYASLIALGYKQFETRSWSTRYRGALAIHAGKKNLAKSPFQTIGLLQGEDGIDLRLSDFVLEAYELPTGCIIATCELTNCQEMYQNPIHTDTTPYYINISSQSQLELAVGFWQPGRFAWRLENVTPLPEPIPAQGKQRIWEWE